MYNQCLKIGYFPSKWKEAKKDNKIPTNYRPSSLLSCIGKLFEKIIAHRMRSKLEEENFFNKWQIGYRNKRYFIDVKKAFDSVWHNGLRYKLTNTNLPDKIVRLMSSFITDILTYKFIDSLKEHSDLFKLQNELRASRIKKGHKTHLDKLISQYAEIYDEN